MSASEGASDSESGINGMSDKIDSVSADTRLRGGMGGLAANERCAGARAGGAANEVVANEVVANDVVGGKPEV